MTSPKLAWPLFAGLLAATAAWGADAQSASKQAFMGLQTVYVSFDISESDTKEFGTGAKNALTDAAHRYTSTVKFELPLGMGMPDTCPPSVTSLSEAMEQGRCMSWSVTMPDDAAMEAAMTNPSADLSKNPMLVPAEYSVDDVHQFRYRDTPDTGFATDTTTSKGRGLVYVGRSGMLLCDLKKLACDLNSVSMGYQNGTDLLTVSTTSDVPGFTPKRETEGPALKLPKVPKDIQSLLNGLPLMLPLPMTKVLTGPANTGEGRPGAGSAKVTIKLTLSAQPAAKVASPTAVGEVKQ